MKKQKPNSRQIELVSDVLTLAPPSIVTFTARGLAFSKSATDAQVLAVGQRLMACRAYLKWALGSFFAELLKRRPAKPGAINDFDIGWAAEFADAYHVDQKERRELQGVFTFFRGCTSTPPGLSFEYHREAMWQCDDGQPRQRERAIAFLRVADREGLSLTGFRKHMRGAQRTTLRPAPVQQEWNHYGAVFDFVRFVKHETSDLANYSPERARLVLHDMDADAIRSFIDALTAIAAKAATPIESQP